MGSAELIIIMQALFKLEILFLRANTDVTLENRKNCTVNENSTKLNNFPGVPQTQNAQQITYHDRSQYKYT